jgi:ribosomal protein S12 methylthiotransferase
VEEATNLAKEGTEELILVAQETTLYGKDLYGEKKLPELLHKLGEIPGIKWIRILYCYPEEITDELIQTIKNEPKVCNYLDIPIQHGADDILRRMGRWTNKQEIIDMVTKLRKEIPDICLRTTLISGFPGETQKNHEEVLEFVKEMKFDRLGVFAYSAEEDTPAADFPDQVPEEVKEQRRNEIMEVQQKIAFEAAEDMLYRKVQVLIEGKLPEDDVYIGRTYKDAPNVDGYIFVHCGHELISGEMITAQVTDAKGYDLIGEAVWE